MTTMTTITTARDLGITIRDITGDASITDAECRDQMRSMDISRYDELTTTHLDEMAAYLASDRGVLLRRMASRLGISHRGMLHTLIYSGVMPNAMLVKPCSDLTDEQYAQCARYLAAKCAPASSPTADVDAEGADADF